jgi:hypothetical protein
MKCAISTVLNSGVVRDTALYVQVDYFLVFQTQSQGENADDMQRPNDHRRMRLGGLPMTFPRLVWGSKFQKMIRQARSIGRNLLKLKDRHSISQQR